METGKLPAETLKRLLSKTRTDPSVLVGPAYGEDAAAVEFGRSVLVAAADPITFATDRIGYYAVSVNANDIAVMGAVPKYFLATILLPEGSCEADAELVFNQIENSCKEIDVTLIGGHTEITQAVDKIVVSGCMLGEADEGSIIRSSGARVGDVLILAGGIAIEGTSILAREAADDLIRKGVSAETIEWAKSYLDDPGICILDYARAAMRVGGVTAMHDPTEGGLATALRELAAASQCGMRIKWDSILVWDECAAICEALGIDPLGLIASGSLLITVSPEVAHQLLHVLHSEDVPASAIGVITEANKGIQFDDGGDPPVFERDEIAKYFNQCRLESWRK